MFHEKTVNNFLNSEQKIIYAKKRANNFINDLCKIVEIVYTEKKWTIFMRKQWTILINVEIKFIFRN